VGRNSKLLLNVPPTRAGLLHDIDAARVNELGATIGSSLAQNLAAGRQVKWQQAGTRRAVAEVSLGAVQSAGMIRLGEQIEQGQRVARYRIEGWTNGAWKELSRGETIGYCKVAVFDPVELTRVRVTVEDAIARPLPLHVGVFPPVSGGGEGR
jgi:alpha-L-fucosidase